MENDTAIDTPRVRIAIADGIADVRLDRPDKLNAIDIAMFDALADAIARLGDDRSVRAVVLSGAGAAFCAGLDLAAMTTGDAAALLAQVGDDGCNTVQRVAWGWRMLPVPVIAAIHGACLGGGLQIASGADIRVAAPDAQFAMLEMRWGIVPDMAGFALWRTLLRDDVLRELVYTARTVSAEEALAIGLVTRLADDPRAAALDLARAIARSRPDAIRAAKRLANRAADAASLAILADERAEQLRHVAARG